MEIHTAIDILGGQSAAARVLRVTPQAVNQWARGRRPVPPRLALRIERLTEGRVRAASLRPDVFGEVA